MRSQHKTVKPTNHQAQLNKLIEKMLKDLPSSTRNIFEKLQKSSTPAICPIHNDNCSCCGMSLPVSLVYDVKGSKEIYQCPTCARILFAPAEDSPVLTTSTTSKYGQRKVGIACYSSPELMISELEATSCEAAITELSHCLKEHGFIKNEKQLIELAMEREAIISTAVDHNAAFPHVRGVEGGGLTFAFGKSSKGFQFDPTDGERTHLVFFIVIPTAASAFYLKLLAGLTESLRSDKNREKMLAADSPAKLWKVLTQVTRKTIK